MKNNKSGKILNVLLSVIALIAIILIIFWLIGKNANNTNKNETFNNSIQKMQETAKEYFAKDLPKNVGDTKIIYLDEMIEKGLSKEIKYGKTKCDESLSYISVTKSSEEEVKIKSNLVCGNKSDNIIDKIKIEKNINNETETTEKENNDSVNIKIIDKTNNSENNNDKVKVGESVCGTNNDGKTIKCSIYEVPTVCTTDYYYEHVKYNVSCPEGYVYNNGVCSKTTSDNVPAEAKYTNPENKVVPAKVNEGGYYKVYTDYKVSGGQEVKYCEKGTLEGNYCYEYTSKVTSSTLDCPTGYTKEGNKCYKYTDLIISEANTCPTGYEKKNNACYKYEDIIVSSYSYCPTGYEEKDGKCVKYTEPTTSEYSYCPSGYTEIGGICYAYTDPIVTTENKTCPANYSMTADQTKCYRTLNPTKTYSNWGNPVREYSTTKEEATYVYELEKKVLMGKNTIKGITTYNYAIYRRTITGYNCSEGTLSNGICYVYTNPIGGNTKTTCPAGYTQSGNTCYKTTNKIVTRTTTCPSGYTKNGNTCYIVTDKKTRTTATCPAGYTQSGNTCYIKVPLTTSYTEHCPEGYAKVNGTCRMETNPITKTTTYCPTGYTDNGTNCEKKSEAKSYITETIYYCPTGYTKEGNGENTKCYKLTKSDNKYYCEDANATLKGDKCYSTVPGKFSGYYCPTGYALDGTTCYKTTTDSVKPIYSKPIYKYSKDKYIYGYERTGKGKYITNCEKVEFAK